MSQCKRCSAEFPQHPGRGRPRTTCGEDCAYFLRLERAQARYHAARQLGATWVEATRLASPRARWPRYGKKRRPRVARLRRSITLNDDDLNALHQAPHSQTPALFQSGFPRVLAPLLSAHLE